VHHSIAAWYFHPAQYAQLEDLEGQLLGVLDAMFLGQPGVLEARQRITLRMRKARRA